MPVGVFTRDFLWVSKGQSALLFVLLFYCEAIAVIFAFIRCLDGSDI
jgi:hypothetical protein